MSRKIKFPSIDAVAFDLRQINTHDSVSTEVWSGMPEEREIEVRLCIENDGEWIVRYGDSQFDQRHSPMCGASSVPGDNRRFRSRAVAKALLDQCRDQYEQDREPEPVKITNTEETLATASPETIVALDAVEAGNPIAYKLLEGVPATICFTNDRYAAKIVSATPTLKTIVAEYVSTYSDSAHRVFRRDKRGVYRAKGGHPYLHIGTAETYRPEEA